MEDTGGIDQAWEGVEGEVCGDGTGQLVEIK